MEFFGYNISKTKAQQKSTVVDQIKGETTNGGSAIAGGSFYGVSFDSTYSDQTQLINIYREMSKDGYISDAIDEITNESIVTNDEFETVNIILDKTEYSDKIKKLITKEFEEVKRLLNFNSDGSDIFRKWYTDGILYAFKKIQPKKINSINSVDNKASVFDKNGITSIEILDPRYVKYVEEKNQNPEISELEKYFLYSPQSYDQSSTTAIKLSVDTVTMVPSGLVDEKGAVISNLHTAIKPYNQLTSLEDAVVVYRIVRAPERRMFFIDVGELPKTQAEEYMKSVIAKNNNNVVYDAESGKMKENTNMRSMLEDIYLPRRDGNRSTDVQTLPAGQNLGEITDVDYFKGRLYSSLKIPKGRLDSDNTYNVGTNNEITREEIKFHKLVDRLRNRFSKLFFNILKTQLLSKKIITLSEWNQNRNLLNFKFVEDSHFTEMKESELLASRLNNLQSANEYLGTYFSKTQINKTILRRSDEQIKETEDQIKSEGSEPPKEED